MQAKPFRQIQYFSKAASITLPLLFLYLFMPPSNELGKLSEALPISEERNIHKSLVSVTLLEQGGHCNQCHRNRGDM